MTDFALTGKKGTGKSKNAVLIIRDRYLRKGQRVATNLDINLESMFGPMSKKTYVRVPDRPSRFDLEAAGHGNPDSYDEDKNGALVLDEMAVWFNARSFSDPKRVGLLDYFAHARKHGYDTFYIMQSIDQVDKQLRVSFIEQVVRHRRYDKVRVPFIGRLLSLLFGERAGWLPRFHSATFRLGVNPQDLVCDSYYFKGLDIEACYDTRQVFSDDYPHGTHSVLSPWHLTGRYLPEPPKPWWRRALASLFAQPKPVARPVLPVHPSWARVVALCRSLPPDQALQVMSRYSRFAAPAPLR